MSARPPDNKSNSNSVPDKTVKTENDESSTPNGQQTSEDGKGLAQNLLDFSATRIAKVWRRHRKTREEEGKILSANSRDIILKTRRSCLHLPGETCPVWSQWEELLNAVEEHLRRKEILEEPPSSSQKLELAMTVVERIAKGSNSVKNHLWLILDTEHWLEICDEKHRYGSNLKVYHDYWLKTSTPENFFDWLDNGSGKKLNLEARPRELLESQLVKYLTKKERAEHEVIFKDGLLVYAKSGKLVHTNPPDTLTTDTQTLTADTQTLTTDTQTLTTDTQTLTTDTQMLTTPNITDRSLSPSSQGSENEEQESTLIKPTRRDSTDGGPKREKWIYVTDCSGTFYVGQKIKGHFHHSSFLAGGAICAAGGIKVREGKLLEINPNSGHYKPAQHHFSALIDRLVSQGIDIQGVKVVYPNENLEKRLMAKYKYKRLAILSMVYDELVQDASASIDNKLSIFKRNITETVKSCKESIKDLMRRIMPENGKENQENQENHT